MGVEGTGRMGGRGQGGVRVRWEGLGCGGRGWGVVGGAGVWWEGTGRSEKGLGGRAFNVNSASSYVVAVFNTVLYRWPKYSPCIVTSWEHVAHCTVAQVTMHDR